MSSTNLTDSELLAELDTPSAARRTDWNPEPGETVIGDVSRFEHPITKRGTVLPVVVLETEGGEIRVGVSRKVLREEMLGKRVQLGDRIAIRFLGLQTPASGGNGYYSYRVAVADKGKPRDEAIAFALEPKADSDLTPEALESTDTEEGAW